MLESLDNGSDFQTVSRDLLAIPHEIGHHLFWKGQMPGKKRTIYKHMQKQLKRAQIRKWDWRRAWLEEIFADAFGCLVAGPVMALSFQELLTDNPPAQFKEDTGHHPIPALRPYIQTKILRAITDANGNPRYRLAPDRLDEKWEAWLADQEWADARKPLQVKYELHGVPHPLPGQRVLEELDEIIKIVLRTLRGQRPLHAGANWNHGSWQAWTTDTHEDDVMMDGLYKSLTFEHFPPRSRWLRSPYVAGQASPPKNPEQILKGWSVEGPTRTGWG
jgi:hypothetical protein